MKLRKNYFEAKNVHHCVYLYMMHLLDDYFSESFHVGIILPIDLAHAIGVISYL